MNWIHTLGLLFVSVGAFAAPAKNLDEFFKDKTKIEKPNELRDPFKVTPSKSTKKEGRNYYSYGKGVYSNINEGNVAKLDTNDIRVVGVLIGKERRVMVSPGKGKEIIILKEGMKVGQDGAELKAILPGGIILVEKFVNVYGQEEYLETVIPISK